MTIFYIMNRCLVMFRRGREVNVALLTKHRHKVIVKQVITLQMAQHLKTKHINVIPGHLFCCKSKAKFLSEKETHCIDDKDKVQSSTDTDNSLNVKHQRKSSNQFSFHLSGYRQL